MLGIPFINQYIQNVVKEQVVADSVDWLNYYVTSLLLAFFSLAISAKQYFGSPIQCWVPNEFRGGWEKYAEDYCFISNSYHVPWGEDVPTDAQDRQDQISYYRWVPIVLALQAVCFFVPNWLWNMLHKQTAVNPKAIVAETIKCKDLRGEDRIKEVKSVANYFHESIEVFERNSILRSGRNATALYLGTKLLYLFNVFAQLYVMNHFLGGDYMNWGFETLKDFYMNREWVESPIFPRIIMCDFEVRRLANIQRHTVQCVIMMNMINEKLYLFLYVWLLFVGVATFINFLYTAGVFLLPMARRRSVTSNMSKNDIRKCNGNSRDVDNFVGRYLRSDGVLVLQFIRQNVGGRVTRELINELFALYMKKKNDMYLEEYSPESIRAGKRPINYHNRSSNYHPSAYGPSSIYPGIEQPDNCKLAIASPRKQQESTAPPSEDRHSYDDATLPIGALSDEARRQNALENIYTTSHVADV